MSAAANSAAAEDTAPTASMKPAVAKPMTLKDVTCDYCDKLITECMCVTAPTHSRYCDDCCRARQFCLCGEGICGGCDQKVVECVCPKCAKCAQRADKCVCECGTCKYALYACRCYEGYEEHPDALCCSHCYSDPCECEANGKQRDLNAAKDYDCPGCGEHYKRCACRRADEDD